MSIVKRIGMLAVAMCLGSMAMDVRGGSLDSPVAGNIKNEGDGSDAAGVPKTGQTTSYRAGDDGAYGKGVAWPDPRFTVTANGTDEVVTDNMTGLMWVKEPHALNNNSGTTWWEPAIDFCNALEFAGHSDWRLPNVRELQSLIDYGNHSPAVPSGHPFAGVRSGDYWSSSGSGRPRTAWLVLLRYGNVYTTRVTSHHGGGSVWPVRAGHDGGGAAGVPKTGQTTSYRAGDDGEYGKGVAWPDPRFTVTTDGADEVVTDTVTGLIWVKAPHALNDNSGTRNWEAAIDFCNALEFAGHTDWRLPNVRELQSLIDYGKHTPAVPSGHPFAGVQSDVYWSSSTLADRKANAWLMSLGDGRVYHVMKHLPYYVWPVRAGQ